MPDAIYGPVQNIAGLNFMDCLTCGATVMRGKTTQHTNFHLTFTNRRSLEVSNAAWCDYSEPGHAFKRNEPGSATFDAKEINADGVSEDTTMEACAEHNPLRVRREAAKYQIAPDAYREVTEPLDRGE